MQKPYRNLKTRMPIIKPSEELIKELVKYVNRTDEELIKDFIDEKCINIYQYDDENTVCKIKENIEENNIQNAGRLLNKLNKKNEQHTYLTMKDEYNKYVFNKSIENNKI